MFLQISELALIKQPKGPPQLPKPKRNTRRNANKLMIVAPADINLQIKQSYLSHSKSETCNIGTFHG